MQFSPGGGRNIANRGTGVQGYNESRVILLRVYREMKMHKKQAANSDQALKICGMMARRILREGEREHVRHINRLLSLRRKV